MTSSGHSALKETDRISALMKLLSTKSRKKRRGIFTVEEETKAIPKKDGSHYSCRATETWKIQAHGRVETDYRVNSAAPLLAQAFIKPIFIPKNGHWKCRLNILLESQPLSSWS